MIIGLFNNLDFIIAGGAMFALGYWVRGRFGSVRGLFSSKKEV